ncbi:MAG: hypothetical protein JRF24_02005 [Deltaproteobacteria bacterium]|nr:hypothetical protein [Deltaproteobacteria bacterium]
MNKKYIIAVAIVIVLWGGFMVYRSHNKETDSQEYRQKRNKRIVEIAKKSPRTGLTDVGKALKTYYKDKGSYPSNLMDLYPTYIRNKPFLTEIDWYYEPKGVDFYLSKTTVINDRRVVAFVDNRLKPQAEKPFMVASPTPVTRAKLLKRPERAGPEERKLSTKSKLALAREEFFNALRLGQIGVKSVYLPEEHEERIISTLIPEIVSLGESETNSHIEAVLSRRYLVWKETNGILGFGNIQYPDRKNLSIYAVGQWYNVKMPSQKREGSIGQTVPTGKKGPGMLASTFDKNYLVWKDKGGTVGFGNIQYPEKNLEAVFQESSWIRIESPLPSGKGKGEKSLYTKKKNRPESIASQFGNEYLVWKNKQGTVGFGNTRYPTKDLDSVFQSGGWITVRRPPRTVEKVGKKVAKGKKSKSLETLASQFGHQYLVWKDKGGAVGFGNVQYPEKDLVSVYHFDNWVRMKRPRGTPAPAEQKADETGKQKGARGTTSKLSANCLIWKGKHGTLGFGNLQYPKIKDVSSICVNGTWEPVSN